MDLDPQGSASAWASLRVADTPVVISGLLLYIDPALSRRLKHLAVDEGKTLQQLGVEALELLLASRFPDLSALLCGAHPKAAHARLPCFVWGTWENKAMQRQRGELVPIAEVIADLPVQALRKTPPPARRGFTVADQVNQLVSASEADADLGFMARTMALCSLPRSNPGNRHQYKRVNGPFTLYMNATADHKLPFGHLPRLLLAWISTEAVRTQSRVLVLGNSLSDFMRELGIYSSDGKAYARLRNQMERLFNASVRLIYEDKHGKQFVSSAIADRGEFWWDPKRPNERVLWDSKIRLGEDFFNEIISHPVPIEMNTLTALKRSPLGLDLYLWLTYRTFALRAPLRLSWQQVYRQFGVEPDRASDKVTVQAFRRKVLRELKKIKMAWPELNYAIAPGVLILYPSTPAIPPAPEPLHLVG